MAKASKGDNSGGTSPATWRRGERKGLETVERFECEESDRKSSNEGRDAMMVVLKVKSSYRLLFPCSMN